MAWPASSCPELMTKQHSYSMRKSSQSYRRARGQFPGLRPPSDELMRQAWETSPNADRIVEIGEQVDSLSPREQMLFTIGVRLEVGERPAIAQGGAAHFEPARPPDHRELGMQKMEGGEKDEQRQNSGAAPREAEGPARRQAQGAAGRHPSSGPEEASSEPSVRRRGAATASYESVGAVADEDRWELGVYFPQFPAALLYDETLGLWYREGAVQPLSWYPARFMVRLYYEQKPTAPPIVRIAPEPPDSTPHLFRLTRNGKRFKALCYFFAPDGTWVRGRSYDDNAAEVLRQVVMWLLRYLVWRHFGFFPGVGVAHDPKTLLEESSPDGPCPLHPWREYRSCCRPRHQRAVRTAQRDRHTRRGILDPSAWTGDD